MSGSERQRHERWRSDDRTIKCEMYFFGVELKNSPGWNWNGVIYEVVAQIAPHIIRCAQSRQCLFIYLYSPAYAFFAVTITANETTDKQRNDASSWCSLFFPLSLSLSRPSSSPSLSFFVSLSPSLSPSFTLPLFFSFSLASPLTVFLSSYLPLPLSPIQVGFSRALNASN